MKKESGITLVSLVIYVIVFIIILGIMSTVVNEFYKNIDTVQGDTEEIVQFNKFNTYFLKEIKLKGNSVDTIDSANKFILFTSGNSFSFLDNRIYYNDLVICREVESLEILQGQNGDGNNLDIIYITLKFENFEKSINYKVEDIY